MQKGTAAAGHAARNAAARCAGAAHAAGDAAGIAIAADTTTAAGPAHTPPLPAPEQH